MAKTLAKADQDELEVDFANFDVYGRFPAAGSWRRMRFLDYFYRAEAREARDGVRYFFWDFVQWYGPTRAEWYWNHAPNPWLPPRLR